MGSSVDTRFEGLAKSEQGNLSPIANPSLKATVVAGDKQGGRPGARQGQVYTTHLDKTGTSSRSDGPWQRLGDDSHQARGIGFPSLSAGPRGSLIA